ncbi:hypothetical protein EOI86_05920 [Hwanghaeella grinnelliae]|uniref:Uncharacterized protein n=1 Tax=Hwanghaeella grinnelliae TaxID=2500179 RepID=A0A3S3URC9_9PROT|nr:hypothetical protein [Hwanghaeella grinnelliae]RVU38804.1 hypothetical protein EOI86_05920 [Hwanghaeella grinnelliae]
MTRLFVLFLLCVFAGCTPFVDRLPEPTEEERVRLETLCGGVWIIADRGEGMAYERRIPVETCLDYVQGHGEPGYPYLYHYLTEVCWRAAPKSERRRRSIWTFDYKDCLAEDRIDRRVVADLRSIFMPQVSCLAWLLKEPDRLEDGFCIFGTAGIGNNVVLSGIVQDYFRRLRHGERAQGEPCNYDPNEGAWPVPYRISIEDLIGQKRPTEAVLSAYLTDLGLECRSAENDYGRNRRCETGALVIPWSRSDYSSFGLVTNFAGWSLSIDYGVNREDGRVDEACYSMFALSP